MPLYPGPQLGPQKVATLGGYVAWVDGRDVRMLGGVFELLPVGLDEMDASGALMHVTQPTRSVDKIEGCRRAQAGA